MLLALPVLDRNFTSDFASSSIPPSSSFLLLRSSPNGPIYDNAIRLDPIDMIWIEPIASIVSPSQNLDNNAQAHRSGTFWHHDIPHCAWPGLVE